MDACQHTAEQAYWLKSLPVAVDIKFQKMRFAQHLTVDISGNTASAVTMASPFVVTAWTNVSPLYHKDDFKLLKTNALKKY